MSEQQVKRVMAVLITMMIKYQKTLDPLCVNVEPPEPCEEYIQMRKSNGLDIEALIRKNPTPKEGEE